VKDPNKIKKIYVVVRQDEDKSRRYAPRSHERRSVKFWTKFQAEEHVKRMNAMRIPIRFFEAEVSEWKEIQ
jgi:hypothetical protein